MHRLPLDQVQVGQPLARAVTTPSGVTLVQAGQPLTAPLISRLRQLGVAAVMVDNPTDAPPAPSREERLRALERRFAGHAGNALMAELKAVVAAQIKEAPDGPAGH